MFRFQVWCSRHNACPFGAIGSVHGWERIGAALAWILRKFFKIAVFRYVDDFFACERCLGLVTPSSPGLPRHFSCHPFLHSPLCFACSCRVVCRPESMKHALKIVAGVIDLLLGSGAAAPAKLLCGLSLVVLGVNISIAGHGFTFCPAEVKVIKWTRIMQKCLHDGHMCPGTASKLAGKLAWGGSKLFHRLGRAMLRPIFDQKSKRDGQLSPELRRALEWWCWVLCKLVAELRPWKPVCSPPLHLFCDAAGTPPHLGAVLFVGRKPYYTHAAVPKEVEPLCYCTLMHDTVTPEPCRCWLSSPDGVTRR